MAAKASYVSLALLLLVGTQLAMGKSVDENFKDDRYNVRALNKRASANEKSKDTAADATTESPEEEVTPIWLITTSKPPKARRQTAKAAATTQAITTPADDDESTTMASLELQEELEEKEDIAPVRPLNNDKQEKPKKKPKQPPTLLDRIKPDDEPTTAAPAPGNPMPPATNLLPPMPYYPQSYGSFPNPAFAPWGFGPAPGPYDYPHPSGPAFSDSKVGGTGSNSGAFAGGFASASASAGGSGTTITTSNTSPDGTSAHQSSHSFSSSGPGPVGIGIRGSFGGGDDDSVAIEVNGPVPSGVPTYSSQQPGYAVSGPGYSASASFSPSPFMNTIPNYGYSGPNDFQNFFQQYFATLQAQQQAFQQQLQAQIQAQQQANGAFASSGAFITNDQGMIDPNANVYANSYTSPNSASSTTMVDSRFGVGSSKSSVYAFPSANKNNANSIWDQSNRLDSNMGSPGGSYSSPNGPASAYSSINLGPQGGYQTAQINPAAPGIFSRFGESVPAPSGGQYGVFSSSSSSSSTGPDGKTLSRKTATVGVNDNGKVSYKTVRDP